MKKLVAMSEEDEKEKDKDKSIRPDPRIIQMLAQIRVPHTFDGAGIGDDR